MGLKKIRKSAGISQVDLSNASDVSQTTISRIEAGRDDKTLMCNARSIVAGLNKLGVECSFSDVFPDDVDS